MPGLIALSAGEARYLIEPPDEAEFGQIVRQPAREAGLRFEHDPASGTTWPTLDPVERIQSEADAQE